MFPTDLISISFQPAGYYLPTSWIEDTGASFQTHNVRELHSGAQTNLSFGWNSDLSLRSWHSDIDEISYLQKYVETGIALQDCDIVSFKQQICDIWQIALDDGYYEVQVGVGKPIEITDAQKANETKIHYSTNILAEEKSILQASFVPNINEGIYFPSKWLHIGIETIQVKDNFLTIQQKPVSFGTQLDYISIKRIKCGLINNLPLNAAIIHTNYNIYYPSTVTIECKKGYAGESIPLRCNLNGSWIWQSSTNSLNSIECQKVECGSIPENILSAYHAYIYWQEYTDYNSTAIVICNSKEVKFIGELVCNENGEWKWKTNKMTFRCPSWTPIKNHQQSIFSQYLKWFIAGIVICGLSAVFGCLHCYSWVLRKYIQM